MFDWFNKRDETKKFRSVNVRKGNIRITLKKSGETFEMPIKGGNFLVGRRMRQIRDVQSIFRIFFDNHVQFGFVKVSDTKYIESSLVKSIELVNLKDLFIQVSN